MRAGGTDHVQFVSLALDRLLNEMYDRTRYARRLRYAGPPPEPPLYPEEAAWLDALLHEKGLRQPWT